MDIFRRVQNVLRPDLSQWAPVSQEWFTEAKLRAVLEKGGFESQMIQITHNEDYACGKDVEDLVELMSGPFARVAMQGWSEEYCARWKDVVRDVLTDEERTTAKVPMVAWVAIATKQ